MATDKMTQNERMVRADGFATRNVAGETILVPIRSGVADLECVYTLDEVATAIWLALETPATPSAVVQRVLDEFDVAEEDAHRDVMQFLTTLRDAGLIREEGGSR
jgi:hypothetical protein